MDGLLLTRIKKGDGHRDTEDTEEEIRQRMNDEMITPKRMSRMWK